MNLRLPLPLRRALLAAMCVLGSQTFAAEYTASTLEEFQTAWNQMADGDTLTITGSIDFEGVELGSLPADASIVLKSDGKGSISNFNYKDMSAVNMQHLNVSGRGTVHVGNMTEGMLSGWDEEGNTLSIENASIQGSSQKNSFLSPLLLCIMLTIVLQGMLRDGVTTWMPSYISETYHLSHAAAILTGVLLPLFGLLCIQSASTLALFCSTGKNAAFSVFFSALLTGCMHGVNLIQVCMIPPFFKKQGNVSTVSGVLNSCTYIGSATSTYGIAVLSDRIGWSSTLLIWVLLTFAGTLICIACARPWRKKFL